MKLNTKNPKRALLLIVLFCASIAGIMAFTNKSNSVVSVNGSGVLMSYPQFSEAKTAWAISHPSGATLGGNISKSDLLQIINANPQDSSISFYFGSDSKGKTYVMFAPTAANNQSVIYRNSAFCPNSCD